MTIVGDGDYRYEVLPEWPKKMPESWKFGMASDVAVDSKDRVWVFAREQHPVSWWTTDGELVGSWGYGLTLGIAPEFSSGSRTASSSIQTTTFGCRRSNVTSLLSTTNRAKS